MRFATWNCCSKFETNLGYLLALGTDVAVVCEAAELPHWPATADGRIVTGLSHRVWPESPRQLAVLACSPWSVTPHEQSETAPAWLLPARVAGPVSFTLVGCWTVEFPGAPSYVRQIDQAADWIEQFGLDQPVVLAGDLNAPIDSSQLHYDRVEARLQDLGLVDAHRVARGLDAGQPPTEATYYHHRRQDKPFHIDHVFLPAEWADAAKVEVGDFDTWVGSGRSDHVPVSVDLS